ncbi:hypothetical protein [Mesorhizobium sp.]|uniref:hypothetical protein n=1 Tax=Mesorhizobium sp. TaxID=1871066 RepID=UPI000FE4FA42|nr:hypothetical protein [Mesorhizobium sp.]RWQ59830.1 MAG: hypothetical protein EOS83_08655 [Mesorhizobium sp.]
MKEEATQGRELMSVSRCGGCLRNDFRQRSIRDVPVGDPWSGDGALCPFPPTDSTGKIPPEPAVEVLPWLLNLAKARHLIFGSDDDYNVSHCPKKFDSCVVVRDNSSKSSDGVGELPINPKLKVYHVVLVCPVDSEYSRSAGEISLLD